MNLRSDAAGFVRAGLLALLFSAAYPMWLAVRFRGGPVDLSTIIYRGGLFLVLLGAPMKYGLLHGEHASAARPAAGTDAPRGASLEG
jgi:hypothetical protein